MIICHEMKWGDCLSHQIWPYVKQGWKDEDRNIHFFWGLGGANTSLIRECINKKEEWWYVDVGYFTEQITRYPTPAIHDKDRTYFRIVRGGIHTGGGKAAPAGERLLELEKKGIVDTFKGWSKSRNKILVCPSSQTVTFHINGISQQEWIDQVVGQLKEYTDREIVVRNKPRPGNQWWNTDIKDDLQDAHALVTNMSLSAIDAILNMVPAFTHQRNVASQVTSRDISKIEKPFKPGKMTMRDWMKFVAEHQFTLTEIGSGVAYETLKRQYEDKIL
jgi:hypothetical protein